MPLNSTSQTNTVSQDPAYEAPAVEVLSAEQIYPNGTRALLPLNLTVKPGEFLTLLGPSGCGKSTLLKMIAGLLEPTNGRILLSRKPVGASDAQKLAFVFQEPTLMPWATVSKNVELPLELADVPAAQRVTRVNAALALVGLSDFAKARPRELSGGMQMRVSIARGLVVEPQLLLMDEPFGALDEITRNRLDSDLLALWKQKNLTVIFVTHSIAEAVFLSTRVIVMAPRPGRIHEEFLIDEPFPRTPEFRVSPQYSRYAKLLQDSLFKVSTDHE